MFIKLFAVGLSALAMGGAHAAQQKQHAYWWVPLEGCTFSTSIYRGTDTLRGTPYIQCDTETQAGGWHQTPESLNPADNVYAPPDMSMGTQTCDYEDVPCSTN